MPQHSQLLQCGDEEPGVRKNRNVDSRWYAVRAKLLPNARIKAVWPYTIQVNDEEGSQAALGPGMAAQSEKGWSWRSRVFRIQYCHERIHLNSDPSPCFQVFVRQPTQLQDLELRLEIELLSQPLSPEQLDAPCVLSKLQPVAHDTIHIRCAAGGVMAYHPATWGAEWWGLAHVTLAACLVGYSTRASMHSMSKALGRDLRKARGIRAKPSLNPRKSHGNVHPGHYALTTASISRRTSGASEYIHTVPATPTKRAISYASFADVHSSPVNAFASAAYAMSCNDNTQQPHSKAQSLPDSLGRKVPTRTDKAVTLLEALQGYASKICPGFHQKSCADKEVIDCLEMLYDVLVMPLRHSADSMRSTLRLLPPGCYAPQTYESMRTLLQDTPTNSQRVFASLASDASAAAFAAPFNGLEKPRINLGAPLPLTARGAAPWSFPNQPPRQPLDAITSRHHPHTRLTSISTLDVIEDFSLVQDLDGDAMPASAKTIATWTGVPETAAGFVAALQQGCSPGLALVFLHAALMQLMQAATTEWSVVQWVLEHTSSDLAVSLRCQWELDQPKLIAPWVMTASELPDGILPEGEGVSERASRAHALLAHDPPQEMPLVYRPTVWKTPAEQPVLLLDDSLAPHMAVTSEVFSRHMLRIGLGSSSGIMSRLMPLPGVTRSSKPALNALSCRPVHLVVFVHGYQGAPSDLGPIKANLHALYPSLECRFSMSNESNTQDSLDVLGSRLADEVSAWVSQINKFNGTGRLGQLSFVGHSMGVMIIRAALAQPKMRELLPYLWMLISVGAPLLGQLYSRNPLLNAGVGLLKALKKGSCLHQLDMSDVHSGDPNTSWLYKLNTAAPGAGGSLQAFRRVVVVACQQDRYVPLHSAELSPCHAAHKDRSWKGQAYLDMQAACTKEFGSDVDAPQLLRVGVHFPGGGRCHSSLLSDVLGRTAHIALIENDEFARWIAWGVVRRFNLAQHDGQAAWIS